ncbi:hypothetical protein FQF73_12820 [Escherichia coli]|nr:hypothetical protein [Escherichia coli]
MLVKKWKLDLSKIRFDFLLKVNKYIILLPTGKHNKDTLNDVELITFLFSIVSKLSSNDVWNNNEKFNNFIIK